MPKAPRAVTCGSTQKAAPRAPSTNILRSKFTAAPQNEERACARCFAGSRRRAGPPLSPAMVFYSRYYIHEMLLVFFTFLALATAWRYWRTRKIGWALLAGAGMGLMHATKETFVITLAAAALALALNQIWNRLLDASSVPGRAPPLNFKHLAAALAIWVLVALVLFSSFFTNPAGPLDSIRTYLPWSGRAG